MADRETDRLAEIKARAEKATPGPWEDGPPAWYRGRTNPEHGKRPITAGAEGTLANVYGAGNAAFVAHAREDIPYLLARIAALEAERDDLKDLARKGLSECPMCLWPGPPDRVGYVCPCCGFEEGFDDVRTYVWSGEWWAQSIEPPLIVRRKDVTP